MLERVRYLDMRKGVHVEAFTDGYAYDDYLRVHLLSAAGRESNVKAVAAAVVNGAQVDILSDEVVSVGKVYGDRYRVLSGRLPSGLLHQVVLSERFFECDGYGPRLIYVGSEPDAADVVYEAVKGNYAVPLLPAWSEWLYQELQDSEMLTKLFGNHMVVELNTDEERLDELVAEGVRSREVSF